MFQLTTVPVLSEVVDMFLGSIIVSTLNGSFLVVPLLQSVSYIFLFPEGHTYNTHC